MFAPEEQLCCHNNYVAPEEQLCCHFFCIVTVCAVLAIALCKDFPQMFSFFAVLIVANATAWATVAYVEKFHGVAYGGNLFVVCGFATSHFDVIFMFPNQRIGEVC